jgi:hypothetical protein
MEQIATNPCIPDPREGIELSDAEFLDLLRNNDPFVRILNLGIGQSAAHIDATIVAMEDNTTVTHINLHLWEGISLDQLEQVALVLPPDVDLSWEPDSSDKAKAFVGFLTNQELSATHEHKKVKSLEISQIHDLELACAVRDYLKSNQSLRAFSFGRNQPHLVSELLQGVLGSNIESLTMLSLHLDSLYTFAEIFWPYLHLRELSIGMIDGAPSLFILGQALEYAQYTLQKLELFLTSVVIDPEEFHEFSVRLPTSCPMLTSLELWADLERLGESCASSFAQMCQELPLLKNLTLNVGRDFRMLQLLKPSLERLDRLDLDFEYFQGDGATIAFSLSDCCNLKSLHLTDCSENILGVVLPRLPHTLRSLKELVLASKLELSSGIKTVLLTTVKNLDSLESVTFPVQGTQSVVANEINHICMIRYLGRAETLMNFPLGLYPYAIAKLDRAQWVGIVHHLVCEKHDELIGSRSATGPL